MSRIFAFAIVLASLACAASAHAMIHPAGVLDGPGNDILDVDGAAMARDGTGGIVYRKQVGGIAHVFVAPFADGAWDTPIEVDGEDLYGASEPTIAAGEGGRLLVVWVQLRNVTPSGVDIQALMSASLQPGASSFGRAIFVDPNVSEPFSGDIGAVDPRLAMAPDGNAYVVYRVVTNECGGSRTSEPPSSSCVPGSSDKVMDVRVARFDYLTWTALGAINREPQIAMRDPTTENEPAIGIDSFGNGVVAWQEPGADHVARIWARRLFGTAMGNVLEASPETVGGGPVTSDADAPAIAVSPYGEARIAFRVHGAPGSAITTAHLYVNSIASAFAIGGSQLTGPVSIATADDLGAPSVSIDLRGDYRVTWPVGSSVDELTGAFRTIGSPLVIGTGAPSMAPTTINPAGGATSAWAISTARSAGVAVRQDYPQGAFQLARLSGTIPGPDADLSLGGSGEGDALIGWMTGAPGRSEVMGAFAQAPPAPFNLIVPFSWVRAAAARISWEPAADAEAGVTYTLYVDGKRRLAGLTGLSARLPRRGLGDGQHHIQVLATDTSGQETMSATSVLRVDADPPRVKLRLIDRGRGVLVTVHDSASGVDTHAVVVSFGDGSRARRGHAVAAHQYTRGGTYTVTAFVRDNAGNQATAHLRVSVL